jgi:hypothetical protein
MEYNLGSMNQVEKEALCYRLLLERDKINDSLRKVQDSMKEDKDVR